MRCTHELATFCCTQNPCRIYAREYFQEKTAHSAPQPLNRRVPGREVSQTGSAAAVFGISHSSLPLAMLTLIASPANIGFSCRPNKPGKAGRPARPLDSSFAKSFHPSLNAGMTPQSLQVRTCSAQGLNVSVKDKHSFADLLVFAGQMEHQGMVYLPLPQATTLLLQDCTVQVAASIGSLMLGLQQFATL